jgi:hypothetical protein
MIAEGYFSGLRTGNQLSLLLNDIALAKSEFPTQTIYFGPRIEFGYMYTKSKSPRGMPL